MELGGVVATAGLGHRHHPLTLALSPMGRGEWIAWVAGPVLGENVRYVSGLTKRCGDFIHAPSPH